jgi:hypothetical protein
MFVPREPLERFYEAAARDVARREPRAISHSVALEDQAVVDADEDDRLRCFIEDELDPREVWASRAWPTGTCTAAMPPLRISRRMSA